MKKFIIVFLLISQISFAADSAKHLNPGEAAPFSGYLITPEKAENIRILSLEHDSYERVNKLLIDENTITMDRLKNSQNQVDLLSKRLVETKDSSFIGHVGFFVLGAALTGLIAYGTTRIVLR